MQLPAVPFLAHLYAQEKFGASLTVLASFKGSVLEGCCYRHPLFERLSPVVVGGDYITTDAGTGLVHTAPGHGQEDYQVRDGMRSLHYQDAGTGQGRHRLEVHTASGHGQEDQGTG